MERTFRIMKIHAYIFTFNEAKLLPFVLDYYSQYCEKITIVDNESWDNTPEVVAKYPKANLVTWSSGGKLDSYMLSMVKGQVYKNSRGQADWVIVCECDEFLYGFERLQEFKDAGIKMPNIEGYHMVDRSFPEYDGKLMTEKITWGIREQVMDKQIIFDPSIDIQYSLGAHNAMSPQAQRDTTKPPLKLLHYKWLGVEYLYGRNKLYTPRIPKEHLQYGIAEHHTFSEQSVRDDIEKFIKNGCKVI